MNLYEVKSPKMETIKLKTVNSHSSVKDSVPAHSLRQVLVIVFVIVVCPQSTTLVSPGHLAGSAGGRRSCWLLLPWNFSCSGSCRLWWHPVQWSTPGIDQCTRCRERPLWLNSSWQTQWSIGELLATIRMSTAYISKTFFQLHTFFWKGPQSFKMAKSLSLNNVTRQIAHEYILNLTSSVRHFIF